MNDQMESPVLDHEVEDQLGEVMEAIKKGASPWEFDERDLGELREHYRPGFEAQKKTWAVASSKILRLAKYQGALAALLAEIQQNDISAPRKQISRSCLWLASYLIQLGCPPHRNDALGKIGPVGPHCPKIRIQALDPALARGLLSNIIDLDPEARVFGEGLAPKTTRKEGMMGEFAEGMQLVWDDVYEERRLNQEKWPIRPLGGSATLSVLRPGPIWRSVGWELTTRFDHLWELCKRLATRDGTLQMLLDTMQAEIDRVPRSLRYDKDYYVMRFLASYDGLCAATMSQKPVGAWPFVWFDLMYHVNTDGARPITFGFSEPLVAAHPRLVTPSELHVSNLEKLRDGFKATAQDAEGAIAAADVRIPEASRAAAVKILKDVYKAAKEIAEWAVVAIQIREAVKEEQRRAAEEREREVRDFVDRMKPMPGAEKHVDQFDRNRDWISRTA